jgi:hypothetical protein
LQVQLHSWLGRAEWWAASLKPGRVCTRRADLYVVEDRESRYYVVGFGTLVLFLRQPGRSTARSCDNRRYGARRGDRKATPERS